MTAASPADQKCHFVSRNSKILQNPAFSLCYPQGFVLYQCCIFRSIPVTTLEEEILWNWLSHHRAAGRGLVPGPIGTGMVAVKSGVLAGKQAGAFQSAGVHHRAMVNSYRMEFSTRILRNLLAAFGMSVRCWAPRSPCCSRHARPAAGCPFPVRLHFFQRSIHGLPAYFGAIRL